MPRSRIKLNVGEKYGMLTVIKLMEERSGGHIMYLFSCECGGRRIAYGSGVRRGLIKSCGCLAKPKVEVNCDYCGKKKMVRHGNIKKGKKHFCNRKCMGSWMSQNNDPNWKEGDPRYRGGYVWIKNGNDDWQTEHIVIVEKILGRKMKKLELIHHINMNKKDNRNGNLLICSRSYHNIIHANMAKRYAEKFL